MNKEEISSTFAQALRGAMAEQHMSQTKLSKLSGVSQGNLSKYLSGKRETSLTTAVRLANALNVSLDILSNNAGNADDND